MRFLTLSSALLLLGLVSAEEPSLECAMYAEACESLCVLNNGGELAVPKCVKESTSCLCDDVDMSDFVNQNAVGYINNLSETDLDQFIDSSYERYEAMVKESAEKNVAGTPVVNDITKLEKDALKEEGMMNSQGAFDASMRNLKFNLVLDEEDDEEGDEEEEEAGDDDSDENDEKQDKNDADEIEDEEEGDEEEDEDEEDTNEKSKAPKEKPTGKPLARAQDPFCQTFLSRCKDDCSAAQSEATCALDDNNSGYLLACACNGVDISSSVYAQVKAENQMVDI